MRQALAPVEMHDIRGMDFTNLKVLNLHTQFEIMIVALLR